MNTVSKGNALEDAFHDYLVQQKDKGRLIYGAYPPHLCKIYKKKNYCSRDRKSNVNFDVVVELFRDGGNTPHLFLVFECKDHSSAVGEIYLRDFSDKIREIFGHACKGVVVVTSRLQSGAEELAKSRHMGLVKFDSNGLEVVLDRTGRSIPEESFIASQIRQSKEKSKSLKFSALYDGRPYCSVARFLQDIVATRIGESFGGRDDAGALAETETETVSYISEQTILNCADEQLMRIGYGGGRVDIERLCKELGVSLSYTGETRFNTDGSQILGSANFEDRTVQVNQHENHGRERFTIAHEIGHFCLQHDRYLTSETLFEQDLLGIDQSKSSLNYDRLEWQANFFASSLLLPDDLFKRKVAELRSKLDIVDKGHGYIFVDDQHCNYSIYQQLLTLVASHFDVSMQAVEVKLRRDQMLSDQRCQMRTIRSLG